MVEIQANPSVEISFESDLLERAVQAALTHQSAPKDATLSILLTDDDQIQALNRDYRGFDKPTDVLSFDVHERDPETGYLYLGEIIISVPFAAKQATQNAHSFESEMQLLSVHGVLHILGHDHAEPEEKAKMWAAQDEILAELGLGKIKFTEE